MNTNTSLVAVRKITSSVPRAQFAPEALEETAHLILSSGTLAFPLILKRTGLESFEVLDGHFGFHAAARARELNPLVGEQVLAFIVEHQGGPSLLKQAELLRRADAPAGAALVGEPQVAPTGDVRALASNFERLVDQKIEAVQKRLRSEQEAIIHCLAKLRKDIPRPLRALEILNTKDERLLSERLQDAGFKGKTLEKVRGAILAASPYDSLADAAARTKGLSAARLLQLVESWSKLSLNQPEQA